MIMMGKSIYHKRVKNLKTDKTSASRPFGWVNNGSGREITVCQKWRTLFISCFVVVLCPVSNRIYVVSVP